MVTKQVLEIHALCKKSEISYVKMPKCNVTNHGFALHELVALNTFPMMFYSMSFRQN